jgi:hypothetical protein
MFCVEQASFFIRAVISKHFKEKQKKRLSKLQDYRVLHGACIWLDTIYTYMNSLHVYTLKCNIHQTRATVNTRSHATSSGVAALTTPTPTPSLTAGIDE